MSDIEEVVPQRIDSSKSVSPTRLILFLSMNRIFYMVSNRRERNIMKKRIYRLLGLLPCGHRIANLRVIEFSYASWAECNKCGRHFDFDVLT